MKSFSALVQLFAMWPIFTIAWSQTSLLLGYVS